MLDRRAVSPPLRVAAAALLCATALLMEGCGNACLSLAEQICVCLPDDGTRAACNKRAKDDEAIYAVRPEDEVVCQQKIDAKTCDCNQLGTPEGKLACGLSYPTN